MQYFTLARAPIAKWAPMVKLVDTADLKSAAFNEAYRFDSGSGHHHIQALQRYLTLQSENREDPTVHGYHLTRFNHLN